MPDVRSDADCRRLIAALKKPIYRGCFTLIYAYGLRISEAVTLPVAAVDSKQMVFHVIRIIQILRGHSSHLPLEGPPRRRLAHRAPAGRGFS